MTLEAWRLMKFQLATHISRVVGFWLMRGLCDAGQIWGCWAQVSKH